MIVLDRRANAPGDIPLAYVEIPAPELDWSVHFSNESPVVPQVSTATNLINDYDVTYTVTSIGILNANSGLDAWTTPNTPSGYAATGVTSGTHLGSIGARLSGSAATLSTGAVALTGAVSVGVANGLRITLRFRFADTPSPAHRLAEPSLQVLITCYNSTGGVIDTFLYSVQRNVDYFPVYSTFVTKTSPVFNLPPGASTIRATLYICGYPTEQLLIDDWEIEAVTIQKQVTPVGDYTRFRVLEKPIEIKAIIEDSAGGWYPVISDGLVYREFVLEPSEPSGSWLRAFFTDGDSLVLAYAVPEVHWTNRANGKRMVRIREVVDSADGRTIRLGFHPVLSIERLFVGTEPIIDTDIGYGIDENDTVPEAIDHIDWQGGLIRFKHPIPPNADVSVVYTSSPDGYIYTGGSLMLDLNPNPGHVISVPTTSGIEIRPASELMTSGVTIYALPCAAWKKTEFPSPDKVKRPNLRQFIYHRFFQHTTSSTAPYTFSASTYGHARFDQDVYYTPVAENYLELPVYSLSDYPSTLVIGHIFVDPGVGFRMASVYDVRKRGGGVSEDNRFADVVKAYGAHLWDIGGWDGVPVSNGGTVSIKLPASLLQYYTREEIERIVRTYIAAGVEYRIQFDQGM